MSSKFTTDALVKIARAAQRGTIIQPHMSVTRPLVEVYLFSYGDSTDELAWYEKHFPGGRHKMESGKAFRSSGRRAKFWDRWLYIIDQGLVVKYSRPHAEHRDFFSHGEERKHGIPVWRCGACRQRITTTQARQLGLLGQRIEESA